MKTLKRLVSGTSAAVIGLSSLMTLGFTGIAHATANNCTWTGASSNNFNLAANWSGCNSTVPQTGDNLVFNVTNLSSSPTLNNDIASLSLGSITFQGTHNANSNHFIIGGLPLSISGMSDSTGVYNIITADVSLTADISITWGSFFGDSTHTNENLNLNGHNITVGTNGSVFANKISGTGNIIVNGGNFDFGGTTRSTWAGSLTVNTGSVTVYPGTFAVSNNVTINAGGSIGFCAFIGADFTNPLTINGRGSSGTDSTTGTTTYSGALDTYSGCGRGGAGGGFDANASVNLSGVVTLAGNTTSSGSGELKVTGPLHGNYTLTEEPGVPGKITIASSDNQSASANGTQSSQAQTTTYTGDHHTANLYVSSNQVAIVDGNYGDVQAGLGGIIMGTGSVNSLNIDTGGIVAPGHSPGKLSVLTTLFLAGGATYQAQLKDTTVGDYDQIAVGTGSDTTGNDVTLGDATNGLPNLDVSLYSGYSIKAGDSFEIIDNLSKTPVKGTFSGLPEGATFKGPNGSVFKISYVAGDGNDVVLTAVTAPTAPNTGLAFVSANPGATFGATVLAAGFIFVLAKSNSRKLAPARTKSSRRRR